MSSPNLQIDVSPDLTSVLDQSIVGTYIIQDGNFVYVNEKLADWFGFDRDEIINNKGPLDLTAPEDRQMVQQKIRERQEGRKESVKYSFTAQRKDGSTFQAKVHGTLSKFEEGEAIIGTLRKKQNTTQAEEVIEDLAWGVANHTGKAFYRLLVVHLASCLNVNYAYIGEFLPEDERMKTLAFYRNGELDDSFTYDIDHPSCQEILKSDTFRLKSAKLDYPNDDLFEPHDAEGFYGKTLINSEGDILGIIWVMNEEPMQNFELTQDVVQIFADRAGAEIDRSRTHTQKQLSEEKYQLVFNSVNDAIVLFNQETGKILNVNDKSSEMFECSKNELIDVDLDVLTPNDSQYNRQRFMAKVNSSLDGDSQQFEWKWRTRNDQEFWGEVTLNQVDFNSQTHVLAVIRDVNLRIQTEDLLNNPNPLDPVTDSTSRSYFYQELQESIDSDSDHKTAVLFLDIDSFKQVNNMFGREIGDRVLRDLAEEMQSRLGDKGIVSRWGGDEFVILLPDVMDLPQTTSIAREILDIFETPMSIAGENVHLTASIGMAIHPTHGDESGDLVSAADLAMFKAKEIKGNAYKVLEEEDSQTVRRQFELERDLHTAIANDQFEIHFQPQFDLATERITGLEALIRWRHPERGFLKPKEFIPLAETTGLILDIDRFVMTEAAGHVHAWNQEFDTDLNLSVNISPYQFEEGQLGDMVKEA
ncbi:MAG: diguanylate cyclase domain-containing protein, partial [bacterium]